MTPYDYQMPRDLPQLQYWEYNADEPERRNGVHILIVLAVLFVLTGTPWGRRVLLVCVVCGICFMLWGREIVQVASDVMTTTFPGPAPATVVVQPQRYHRY